MSVDMTNRLSDAHPILNQAKPFTHQHAHEIQPFGHLVKLPIALAENVCRESVENLNQLLADRMTLRDLYKKHHWQLAGPTFYHLISCSTRTTSSRTSRLMPSRRESNCSAASVSPWLTTSPRRPLTTYGDSVQRLLARRLKTDSRPQQQRLRGTRLVRSAEHPGERRVAERDPARSECHYLDSDTTTSAGSFTPPPCAK
jgi:hypothetical protein